MTGTVGELFGTYRIGELLGRGGMGEVYRAHDTEHDRPVALKLLPGYANEEFRARFRREARLAAGLTEPHVVPIYDHGEINGQLYLAMALIEGPDLKRVLADGPLEPARAVAILTQVASALDAAHAAGVLHRDVKPANILVDDADNAYLADFGIARSLDEDVTKLTNTGDYVGTLDYMAPERLMRGDLDAGSDVYSLACVLFQCLTGRVPFPAPDSVGKLSAQLNDPPPAPSLFDRRIPPAMDLVVRTGMDKDPKRRYPSAGELMAAASGVTAEAPTAVPLDVPRTGDHFVHLLMTFAREQEHPPTVDLHDRCPYPGLQSFGMRDSDWFFGREQAVRDLLTRLSRHRADDGPLMVVGASGAGKSSLLHAGLLSAHAQAGELALAMTPGDHPIGTLAARLAALTRTDARQLANRLWARPGDFGELCRSVSAGQDAPLVVAVDQAEELFTQCRDPREREAFAIAIASAWPARVVVAIRADFVEHCITLPALKPSLDAPYVLGPLTAAELSRVVTKPAEAAGLDLEPGLVDRLITDVGAGRDVGALPRLAHALRETWHNRTGNRLTLNGYQRTGGVDRAVALTADGMYERLAEPDRWALRATLLRMVTLLDGGGIARRRANRAEVPPRVLESLVAARLVTVDQDSVMLSHDALLTAWPRLREWVEEDRHGLLVRQQLREAAAGWRKSGQDRGDLYRGARLAAALDWGTGRTDLSPDETAFLKASERDRKRSTRRLRGVVAGLAGLLVVALVAGVIAVVARADAEQERLDAESRQLAAESQTEQSLDPVSAMRKAVEAWRASPTVEARGALLAAPMLTYPSAFSSGVGQGFAIDLSSDGSLVAIGSGEGEIALWDVRRRKRLDVDIKGSGMTIAVKFSPDDKLLAVSSIDTKDFAASAVKIWSVPDGKLVGTPSAGENAIGPVAWRPDGSALAAPSIKPDATSGVGEWDPKTGELIRWVTDTGADTMSLAYSESGDRLAAGHGDGSLELWDTATATLVVKHTDHRRTSPVDADVLVPVQVAYSGLYLASASVSDNIMRLWDPKTGALVREFADTTRHESDPGQGPTAMAFNADGNVLYTNSDTTRMTIWDTGTGDRVGTLDPGPGTGTVVDRTVVSIAVSKDGRTKVAANSDGTVLRWRVNPNWLNRPDGSISTLDFSSDGETIAAGDADGGLETASVSNGESTAHERLDSGVLAVRYTGDGTRVTGTNHATFTVTPPRGEPKSVNLDGRSFLGAMALTPDGKLFAAVHFSEIKEEPPNDFRITVWETDTLRQREELALGERWPTELVMSPGGDRMLALLSVEGSATVGSDSDGALSATTLMSWRVPDFTEESAVSLGKRTVRALVFAPDGKTIVTAGITGAIEVRDARTGEVRYKFGSHAAVVRRIAISPDGRTVASITTDDAVVRVWDLVDRELRAVLTGHAAALNEVEFSPDGKVLATGGTDTDVGLWRLDPEDAVRQLCANLADADEKNLDRIGC